MFHVSGMNFVELQPHASHRSEGNACASFDEVHRLVKGGGTSWEHHGFPMTSTMEIHWENNYEWGYHGDVMNIYIYK